MKRLWWFPQDVSKRMSLPMDIRLPPEFLKKLQLENENSPLCKPLSRMSRRASLVSAVYLNTDVWAGVSLADKQ